MKTLTPLIALSLLTAYSMQAQAQTFTLPEGTPVHVRLEETISSATDEKDQEVRFEVTEPVVVNGMVLIAEGAPAVGIITEAQGKRRMGRSGHIAFSIDRVRATDNKWVKLTYQPHKNNGSSHGLATGVAVGVTAAVFWPAAPAFLLIKGSDKTINRGVTFDVFTETDHVFDDAPVAATIQSSLGNPASTPLEAQGKIFQAADGKFYRQVPGHAYVEEVKMAPAK
jgi:hypothetical protein